MKRLPIYSILSTLSNTHVSAGPPLDPGIVTTPVTPELEELIRPIGQDHHQKYVAVRRRLAKEAASQRMRSMNARTKR